MMAIGVRARINGAGLESEQVRKRHILACAARLPSPPDVVMALIGAMDDDEKGADQVAGLVARDQGLTARVLKISNSSFYGLSGQIGTVNEAVVILGFSNVSNLVIATEIANRYPTSPATRDALAGFWPHAMLTAFCASALANRCGAETGFAFTGGLLHDIGKLVLASAYPDDFSQFWATAPGAEDVLALESERFGMDHAVLGGWITEQWCFPAAISVALRAHHTAQSNDLLARVIRHADQIAHALALPAETQDALQTASDALIGLGARDSAPDLLAGIERHAGAASELFQKG